MKTLLLMGAFALLASGAFGASAYEIQFPVFPKSKAPAKTLYYLDLLKADMDVRFAMTVLQGLVNREEPRMYVSQNPEWHGTLNFDRYMDDMKKRGHTFEPMTPEEAVAKFAANVKGAVLYESDLDKNPESLHKLNALTLYCALEDCLPVTEALNAKLKLPVVLDVRGKYNTAFQAYTWAYAAMWPRANHKLLAHTCPTHMVLRDYLVQHKVMPIWISKGMPMRADNAALRFLREAEPNSPLMGCWGGYGEVPLGRYTEPDLQRMASGYGKFIVVSDGCFNLSVFSGLTYQRPVHKPRKLPALDKAKTYVVFHITDGDNIQWLQQEFISSRWWLDPSRGKVPISWSLAPLACEVMPNFVEMVQSTATDNDEFVCPTAGIGLITPSLYGAELRQDRDAVYDAYLGATSRGMERVGQRCIHLGDTSNVPWTRADFDRCARGIPAVKGILGDYGKVAGIFPDIADYTVSRDVVVLRALAGAGPAKNDDECARQIAGSVQRNTPKDKPAFVHVCLVNWFVTPTAIAKAAEILGDAYVPVLPSEIVDLYHQAH